MPCGRRNKSTGRSTPHRARAACAIGPDRGRIIERAGKREAWRIPLAGGPPLRDAPAPWCMVQPAPTGGWRLFERRTGIRHIEAELLPPGASPGDRRARTLGYKHAAWQPDGTAIIYYDPPSLRRLDLATGADTVLSDAFDAWGVAPSPDGQTIYTSESTEQDRRYSITNFAARPGP